MNKKNVLPVLIIISFTFFVFLSCSKKDTTPVETCYDNIKNQNEVKTDCGGVCKPCAPSMTATINGNSWTADTSTIAASYSNNSTTFKLNGRITVSPYSQMSMVYLGAFTLGSHNLDHSSSFTPNFTSPTTFVSSGSITISEMDSRINTMSGTFSFTTTGTSSNYNITNGSFTNISYRIN
jgi:hypothetical protein